MSALLMKNFYKTIIILICFFTPLVFFTITDDAFNVNKQALFNLLIATAYVYWAIEVLFLKQNNFRLGRLFFLLLVTTLFLTISTAMSMNPVLSYKYLLNYISLFLFFFLISNKLEFKDFGIIVKTLFLSAVIISVYAILQFLGFDFIRWVPKDIALRPIATFGNPIFLANFLAIIAPWSAFYYLNGNGGVTPPLQRRARAGSLLVFILLYTALYLTFCRSGYLAFLISVFLLFSLNWNSFKKEKNKILTLLFVIIFIPLAIQCAPVREKTNEFIKAKIYAPFKESDINISTRFYLWKSALNLAADSPLVGTGAGVFSYAYAKYRYLEPVAIRGRISVPGSAHNHLLDWASSAGLPFFIAVCFIIFYFFSNCYKSIVNDKDSARKNFIYLMISAGAAYWAGAFFVYTNISEDLLWYVLLGFCSVYLDKKEIFLNKHKNVFIAALLIFALFNLGAGVRRWLAEYHCKRALIAEAVGDYRGATEEFGKSVVICADNSNYYQKMGKMFEGFYAKNKNPIFFAAARNAYFNAVNANKHNSYIWADLARLCAFGGNHKDAVKYYLQALFLDPYNSVFLNDLGTVFYDMGKENTARAYYLESLSIYPYSAMVNANLAALYVDKKDYEKAKIYLLRALKYDGEHNSARELLRKIEGKNEGIDNMKIKNQNK